MTKLFLHKIDLRRLILVLTIVSALVSLANTMQASYLVQSRQLIDSALESNAAYAAKLANSTNDFIEQAQQQLAYSAALLGKNFGDEAAYAAEVDRLRLQTDSFNSVMLLDSRGEVLATSPENQSIMGMTLQTPGVRAAMEEKKPAISTPYISAAGNFIVFISSPVWSPTGKYLGLIGGSIYLRQPSILNRLLASHYHKDGSYVYVVSHDHQLIYHPQSDRVGDYVQGNTVIDKIAKGLNGSEETVNSRQVPVLAGYAVVQSTGWGVVAQRPKAQTLAPIESLMQRVIFKTLPITLISLLVIWWCARQISRPLRLLANSAQSMDDTTTEDRIQTVNSWYFEAQELKRIMLLGIGLLKNNIRRLHADVHTDPLTGLGNRRSLDAALTEFQTANLPFAAVSVDIDFFKKINDTYGHDVGDQVLQSLANCLKEVCRAGDVPCRVGGEEFLILLPGTDKHAAAQMAERLRRQVEAADMPMVGNITVSLGVAHWPDDAKSIAAVLKLADDMLYQAKRGGRNRVAVFE
ncbi:GGDEF domain-containing protein [Pusillimonas sp. CC-YST705]|uniref:diguanylate cyclase n=1 Tax=Mesopusillimonas faecipullorum TaxID=2755040 RepID=A0ABS8C9N5_9BURK|nr:sensor domain-containing diguanylate cyclase [Mesopusillimonas faecipullorum]MCB5362713.1 GGDEF domain-containing protein [Mesopusillimonas faecipullorum]